MRNSAGCKKFKIVDCTSRDINLVCTTTGYTGPISQLLDKLVVIWILCTQPLGIPAMIYINFGCTTIGKIELSTLTGYRRVGYAISVHTQLLGMLAVIWVFRKQQSGTLEPYHC